MTVRRSIGIVLAVSLVILVVNGIRLGIPAGQTMSDDPRNAPVTFVSYYAWGVHPNIIVFDLWDVDGSASKLDVMRVLLQFSDKLQERSFDEVRLAWRGDTRFIIPGTYFQQIGSEYSWQNPVYTIRTFPENIVTHDGRPAFSTWTGGMLGVLGQQMDDVSEFHDRWYGSAASF